VAGNAMAYIGDAAGFIDPLTGEGIYNALLSSQLLVESLCLSAETDHNLEKALNRYKSKKWKVTLEKKILNHFFQLLITKPTLVKWTVQFLKTSHTRADIFIGIIGNIYNPLTGLIKMLKV
jgi:flavin-dependent dehydrogenase